MIVAWISRISRPLGRPILLRSFHSTRKSLHGDFEWQDPRSEEDAVNITYVLRDGSERKIKGKVGDNCMYLAHRYNIELEGACEASCACSTCHVYVETHGDKLEEPKEEEDDMLDQAPVVRPNSRLACQITLSKDLDGIRLTLPPITRNFYVDGHVPQPH
ncbi:hypothetical protein PMAYCL1PPCAC_18308 [Pristionchus mayeri]|uniref:2Fe-2S ferredoxin-type domain-containing protein n=1 Tax=Pristionchus mayeri TaxID=1317129 RepID=A0AAN5CPD1_9BILA|nr:hypothetical protein PMAYCL1PPCAC_18308 [Pristionchus mayeri]